MNILYVDCEGVITSPQEDNIEALVQTAIACTAADEQVRPERSGAPGNLPPTTANGLQDERCVECVEIKMNGASFDAIDKMGQPNVAPVAEDTGEYFIGIALDADGASSNALDWAGVAKEMEFIWDIGSPVGRHFDLETRYLVNICPGGIYVERSHLQFYAANGLPV